VERVLITGLPGFTASRLLDHLRQEAGNSTLCVGVSRHPYTAPDGVQAVACDLVDGQAVRRLLADVQPTRVFHLAGTFTNEFNTDFSGNVVTTQNLLDAALELADPHSCRILIPGSAAEYGYVATAGDMVSERHPLRPVSAYGLTKVFQTQLAGFYARARGLHVVIARTFNLLGRGASRRLMVGRLYEQIQAVRRGEAEEITLGDVSGARDYIDVRDAIRAYIDIIEHGTAAEVYNVGSGRLTQTAELLRLLLARYRVKGECVRLHTDRIQPSDASPCFCADTRKLQGLGWAPQLSIEDAVRLFDG
jgi:GDP-4-dehydro-6-deoxy-D-mannose reductase